MGATSTTTTISHSQSTKRKSSLHYTTTSQWVPLKTVLRLSASVPSLLTSRPRPLLARSSSTNSLATRRGRLLLPTTCWTTRMPPTSTPRALLSPSTPINWLPGDDVIVHPTVKSPEAEKLFPKMQVVKPYLRFTPLPKEDTSAAV